MDLGKDTTLQDGKYTILNTLGRGGFGVTYKAVDNTNGQVVAIKEYFPSIFHCYRSNKQVLVDTSKSHLFEKWKDKFAKEAHIISKIKHPNIVSFIATFQENNTIYYVMSYIQGQSIEEIIAKKEPIKIENAIPIIIKIANAIQKLHQENIIHRDIKPANIVIDANTSEPILIDFGAALEIQENDEQTRTTIHSDGYAPPELYTGVKPTFATDIYSLTATLYYMITAQKPMRSISRTGGNKLTEPKDLNLLISKKINTVILQSLELQPEKRPQNITKWIENIQNNDEESLFKGINTPSSGKSRFKFIAAIIAFIVILYGLQTELVQNMMYNLKSSFLSKKETKSEQDIIEKLFQYTKEQDTDKYAKLFDDKIERFFANGRNINQKQLKRYINEHWAENTNEIIEADFNTMNVKEDSDGNKNVQLYAFHRQQRKSFCYEIRINENSKIYYLRAYNKCPSK